VKGYSNFSGTPGHEFVGVVETATEKPELIGRRVVGEINAGCGFCELCIAGDSRHCPNRTVLGIVGRDGAHAEYVKLPAMNLLAVPDNITNEAAVFVEPLAAAVGIMERVQIRDEDKVAVIGDGKLGILAARALAASRSNGVVLFGKDSDKLALASRGSFETVNIQSTSSLPTHFDVVVEASGSESGFETALQIVKPRGTIVLKSTYHGRAGWDASRVVVNEVAVVGSRCGRFAPALELLASNQIRVDDLISDEFRLSDGVRAFERAGAKGVLKVLIGMEN
jgi:threonine dehydrogenase-like Zn-dependent dehydrogenase